MGENIEQGLLKNIYSWFDLKMSLDLPIYFHFISISIRECYVTADAVNINILNVEATNVK